MRRLLLLLAMAVTGYAASVVVIGTSSSSSGYWSGDLKTALEAQGYTVTIFTHGGVSVSDIVNYIDTEVAPLTPDFVIVAANPSQEPYFGDAGNLSTGVTNFLAHMETIVSKVSAWGGKTILGAAVEPNNQWTDASYLAAFHSMQAAWLAYPTIDHFDGLRNAGASTWIAALTADGQHPTQPAPRMYEAISLNLFAKGYLSGTLNSGSWKLDAADSSTNPVAVSLDRDATSFTLATWVKNGQSGARTYASATRSGGSTFAISTSAGGYYQATATGMMAIVSSLPVTDAAWHHLALSYEYTLNVVSLYLDGALVGTGTPTQSAISQAVFGGAVGSSGSNATGVYFSDVMLYRAPLADVDAARLAGGSMVRKSLEIWLSMASTPPTASNDGDTTTAATVNGTFVSGGIRGLDNLGVGSVAAGVSLLGAEVH